MAPRVTSAIPVGGSANGTHNLDAASPVGRGVLGRVDDELLRLSQ